MISCPFGCSVVGSFRLQQLKEVDGIFIEESHSADWYHRTSQAFAVLLPVKSVGVVGDGLGGVSRVTYDVSSKLPATIEWE